MQMPSTSTLVMIMSVVAALAVACFATLWWMRSRTVAKAPAIRNTTSAMSVASTSSMTPPSESTEDSTEKKTIRSQVELFPDNLACPGCGVSTTALSPDGTVRYCAACSTAYPCPSCGTSGSE